MKFEHYIGMIISCSCITVLKNSLTVRLLFDSLSRFHDIIVILPNPTPTDLPKSHDNHFVYNMDSLIVDTATNRVVYHGQNHRVYFLT